MSPSAYETLGIQSQDMVGTYFARLVHPDDLGGAEEMFSKAVQGTLATTTVRVRHANGSWALLDAIASVIAGPDGQPQHILATGRDVTERAAGAAAPGAEDGGDRPARRRHRPRLQQPAHRHRRLRRAAARRAATGAATRPTTLDEIDAGRRARRGADAAAARVRARQQIVRPTARRPQRAGRAMRGRCCGALVGEDVELASSSSAGALAGSRPTRASSSRSSSTSPSTPATPCPTGGDAHASRPPTSTPASRDRPTTRAGRLRHAHRARHRRRHGRRGADAQVFEPFFTTKELARAPASGSRPSTASEPEGGAIWMDSTLGAGTCFSVCLPEAGDAP